MFNYEHIDIISNMHDTVLPIIKWYPRHVRVHGRASSFNDIDEMTRHIVAGVKRGSPPVNTNKIC